MSIVKTITGKCRMCYACIRQCPVKAIKVVDGQAQVVPEMCIGCGHCVKVCSQKAKMVERDVEKVEQFLNSGQVIACLAPSFVAEFYPAWPGQVVTALKRMGFTEVHEVAFGAHIITQEYRQYLQDVRETQGLISTPCPAIVNIVTKYYPRLIPQLVPIVSPMIALGRYLKKNKGPNYRIVFIGPCAAKKSEIQEEEVTGAVDAVLTYPELKEMLETRSIDVTSCGNSEFDSEPSYLGRLFPVGGGLMRSIGIDVDILTNQVLVIEGQDECLEFLRSFNEGKMMPWVADILFCKGCINGPIQENRYSTYRRRKIVAEYTRQGLKQAQPRLINLEGVSLRREFHDKRILFSQPSESEIKAILAELGKNSKEDELNCGACGYPSCRDKAVAVYQGLAENRMCLPYLITTLEENNLYLRQELKVVRGEFNQLVGNSVAMQEVYRLIEKVAKTDVTVFIRGESGTGKELVARTIHYNSFRSEAPFISINCSALPENLLENELFGYAKNTSGGVVVEKKGLFEEAHRGTILLDEIGDISLEVQSKLLRVLQHGEIIRLGENVPTRVNVRIIATTNRDIEKAVQEGKFRPELYYRLNVVNIWLPALRERRDDIPLLARYFKDNACKRLGKEITGFTQEAMDALIRADWPGNVRELQNVVERAVILAEGKKIELGDLPRQFRNLSVGATGWAYTKGMSFNEAVEAYECSLILQALEEAKGVQARAAEILGLKRSTLNEMIKRHNLKDKHIKSTAAHG